MNRVMIPLMALTILGGLVTVIPAEAKCYGRRWGVNAREARQQQRLYNGIQNGSLTPREAARLEHQEAKINRQEWRMRHDGNGLQPAERARLERELNRTSQHIYHQKHDAQGR